MRTKLLKLALVLTLALGVATVAMWTWSTVRAFGGGYHDMRDARGRDTIWQVYSHRGRIEWWWAWNRSIPSQVPRPRRWAGTADLRPPRWPWTFETRPHGFALAGFYVERRVRGPAGSAAGRTGATYVAAVPHWFVLATLLLLARWQYRVIRRRRRYGPAVCRACGYDLRATPDRCPECGKAASSPEPERDGNAGAHVAADDHHHGKHAAAPPAGIRSVTP
jgi:hypothetical protein